MIKLGHPALRKVSTCRTFPVTAPSNDCKIVEFMREKVQDYKPTQGHGYYQFTKKEHIPPDAKVVLMDKVNNSNISESTYKCFNL